MGKRVIIAIVSLCLAATAGLTTAGIVRSNNNRQSFSTDGYVLQGDLGELKQVSFSADASYLVSRSGVVTFDDASGDKITVSQESFVRLNDGSVMALSDGVLLDFNDLSENFVNNYTITAGLPISGNGGGYTAETSSGTVEFGEHVWKLSDVKYMVEAPAATVYFSDDDVREVADYVQVTTSPDGIVRLLTPENLWATISDSVYIETEGGVRIYPVSGVVDNGTYKISLAKMSVEPDETIVLSEAETRRQIVPEFDIETIDGEDGVDGLDGEAGEDGTAGEAGNDGEAGENGENGETGAMGESGSAGAQGQAGTAGRAGAGVAAGSNGRRGDGGDDGDTGPRGSQGADAKVASTINVALPTMRFNDMFTVTATGVSGEIEVTDESELLDKVNKTTYPGSVTIYNLSTGERIPCYTGPTTAPDTRFSFGDGTSTAFYTLNNALTPDTQYRISVTAYYATEDDGMVYSREFVTRTFYTDSTGVLLSAQDAASDSVTVNVAVSEAYQGKVQKAVVYLLDAKDEASFSSTNTSASVAHYILNYNAAGCTGGSYVVEGNTTSVSFTQDFRTDLKFDTPTPDTRYIARVIVTTRETNEAGETLNQFESLTNQRLELTTLKRTPVYDASAKTTAYFNRSTGAYEVFRIPVTDPDLGTVKYTYRVYDENDVELTQYKQDVPSTHNGAFQIYLPTSGTYRFGVEMEFNDNAKTIVYKLGKKSDPLSVTGNQMPTVRLNASTRLYNKWTGTLTISPIGESTRIKVGESYPLVLTVYANQVYNRTITIKQPGDGGKQVDGNSSNNEGIYTVTLDNSSFTSVGGNWVSNGATLNLDFDNLYRNTTYTVTVSGYLDLGTGENGADNFVWETIGTDSFSTPLSSSVGLVWTPYSAPGQVQISRTLKIESDTDDMPTHTYEESQIAIGQVTLSLYQGTGSSRREIQTIYVDNQEDIQKMLAGTYEVTENVFGVSVSAASEYTLMVSEIADHTRKMALGYVNTFNISTNQTETIVTGTKPPDLMRDPAKGVTVTPIINKNAKTYGASYDNTLSDDTIIGFKLQSNYDNSQRLITELTYYAFEYNAFFNALGSTAVVQEAMNDTAEDQSTYTVRAPITLDEDKIPKSDTVPAIVLLFGAKPDGFTEGAWYEDAYVYYGGEVSQGKGMSRGYRYAFAYTAKWSTSGSAGGSGQIYPYQHGDYEEYKNQFGAGMENGIYVGRGREYVLNSGMVNAPREEPKFRTYVYNMASTLSQGGENRIVTDGTVNVHFRWIDPDDTISIESGKETMVHYTFGNDEPSMRINTNALGSVLPGQGNVEDWYALTFQFRAELGGNNIVEPWVEISTYNNDYRLVLSELGYEEENSVFYLCHIPVDLNYRAYFANHSTEVNVTQIQNFSNNLIEFELTDAAQNNTYAQLLGQRAYAMELVFSAEGVGSKTIVRPLSRRSSTQAYYCQVATGQLGNEFLNKEYAVTAQLLYDDGLMGWQYAEDDNPVYAMQQTNATGDTMNFSLGSYMTAGQNGLPSNALITTQVKTENLRGVVAKPNADGRDEALSFIMHSYIQGSDQWNLTRRIYPDHWGVRTGSTAIAENLSEVCAVPKHYQIYQLKFSGDANTGTITYITPTVSTFVPLETSAEVYVRGLTVVGFSGMDPSDKVYARLYDSETNARGLTGGYLGEVEIDLPTSGSFDHGSDTGLMKSFSGLAGEKTYYVALYMKNGSEVVPLIKGSDASRAVYQVVTSAKVRFSSINLSIKNDSYYTKELIFSYYASRSTGVTAQYDIYEGTVTAENVESFTPLLDYAYMTTDASGKMGQEMSLRPSSDLVNTLQIKIPPGTQRRLLPGKTYTMVFTAYNSSGAEDGRGYYTFTIPTILNSWFAYVYAEEAGADFIKFKVSINDSQRAFMGRKDVQDESGLYAVRFTDKDGNWIPTKYDGKVYPIQSLSPDEFILSNETMANEHIQVGKEYTTANSDTYRLKVYAVLDEQLNGVSRPYAAGVTGGVSDFFGTGTQDAGEKFKEFLQRFWYTALNSGGGKFGYDTKNDTYEGNFIVADVPEALTGDDGVRINESAARASMAGGEIVVRMEQSFGLLSSDHTMQTFDRIDWTAWGRSGGTIVSQGGTLQKDTDTLFTWKAGDGYGYYELRIPTTLSLSSFTVQLSLYKNGSAAAADYQLTIGS